MCQREAARSTRRYLGGLWGFWTCLLCGLMACQIGPDGTDSKALSAHEQKTSAPYRHSFSKDVPYSHTRNDRSKGHQRDSRNPIQYGAYGKKGSGASNTGLSNYFCSCLLTPSDWVEYGSYYVCARDPVDAATFAGLKCAPLYGFRQSCTACVCYPGISCTARGS